MFVLELTLKSPPTLTVLFMGYKIEISHQSGSQVVPILLTVYLFQPSTGGKVQTKEKVQTNSRPSMACFACSRMFPSGRQITKNRSKDRTAKDQRATIPEQSSSRQKHETDLDQDRMGASADVIHGLDIKMTAAIKEKNILNILYFYL